MSPANSKKNQKKDIINNGQRDTRMNLLYIFLTLKKYSSAEHPMLVSEIIEKISQNFTYSNDLTDSHAPVKLNASTVNRILDAFLYDNNFAFLRANSNTDYDDPNNLGYCLYCVTKENNTFVPYVPAYEAEDDEYADNDEELDKKSSKPARKYKYYYLESNFSDAELKILIDAMEVYQYFGTKDITKITNKLLLLHPQSSLKTKRKLADKSILTEDAMIFHNIAEFQRLMKEQKLVEINYYYYGHTNGSKLQPILRSYYPKVIRPVSMMWSNGYYYLIAMMGPAPKFTPTHLRLDRVDIHKELETKPEEWNAFEPPQEFTPAAYRLKHPVMFGGEEQSIRMLCRQTEYNGMMNAIRDTFGLNAVCRPATQEELEQYLSYGIDYQPNPDPAKEGKWVHVRITSTTGGVELFATQYCRNCRVIYPQSVVDRVKRNLEVGTIFYK